MSALDGVRILLLEIGDELMADERIEQTEDVWFLEYDELLAALEDPAQELRTRIATRRADHLRHQGMYPPRVMTSEGEIPQVRHAAGHAPAGALVGSPASGGVVEGIARVVMDPRAEVLDKGEILVAPFTDPGWTPLFLNAAGLVMEVGGLMTHGSVVAREYGIPAVVCVPGVTKQIRTGQRIRVHGDGGWVEILDAEETA
jgi:rifampicin phosphotransferase